MITFYPYYNCYYTCCLSDSRESQYRGDNDPGTIAFVFNDTYANIPVSGGANIPVRQI